MRRAVQALGVARTKAALLVGLAIVTAGLPAIAAAASGHSAVPSVDFPPTLEGYGDAGLTSLGAILRNRVEKVPFNLWATLLFLGAIIHTFATHRFQHIAHVLEQRHEAKVNAGATQNRVSAAARFFHFLGEPEVVFGLWTLPLFVTITLFYDRSTSVAYLNDGVNFTEAVFVVVIMTIALAYSTLGLLFVAISVGGTLTNFAAPPVLMVADAWGWTTSHMLVHFGWKAMLGIVIATLAYYLYFRRELHTLSLGAPGREAKESARLPIPL